MHEHERNAHHPHPFKNCRVIICYKNFSKECDVSHIGLGVTAQYTAKTLVNHGVRAEAKAIFGSDDLTKILEHEEHRGQPITHVVICAQWIPIPNIARLCLRFPITKFALNCHSNVGFLQAEPPAINILRQAIDLETGTTNFFASVNNQRLQYALEGMYGRPIQFLPNLYWLHGKEQIHRPVWSGGVLRVGAFGSHRIYKNFSNAVAAAVALSHQLHVPLELWINAGRHDGHGDVVFRTAKAWTHNLPNVQLKELPWATWPEFKRWVGSMNLLLQPSYTETFNNVTADGVTEGVPSVVSDTIDWAPKSWFASTDDTMEIAGIARRLLTDPHAAKEGYDHLKNYVRKGIPYWEQFLSRP
jgi:hypothetical protein